MYPKRMTLVAGLLGALLVILEFAALAAPAAPAPPAPVPRVCSAVPASDCIAVPGYPPPTFVGQTEKVFCCAYMTAPCCTILNPNWDNVTTVYLYWNPATADYCTMCDAPTAPGSCCVLHAIGSGMPCTWP